MRSPRTAPAAVAVAVSDVELARRCVAGDCAAQRDFFHRERRHVHATLYRVLGSNSDIDDLVQDAFLEIFRSMPSFRGDATLSTWLDRITVRVAYAYIARKRPDTARLSLIPDLPAGDPSAEERVLAREAARRLYAVLDGVEARQRVAYTLHVIDGRPLTEVARIMESSVVLTKVRAWRAARTVEKRARRDPLLARFLGDAGRGD